VRFNALAHGLRAESAIMPGEDIVTWNACRKNRDVRAEENTPQANQTYSAG
jgi:hypothetical protein